MKKAIIFKAYDGTEIIDTSPEAEIRIFNMDCLEDLYKKRRKREDARKHTFMYRFKMALLAAKL